MSRELGKHISKKFIAYTTVGLTGLVVDTLILNTLNLGFGINATIAAIISGECGIINNFFLNDKFTFKKSLNSKFWDRFLKNHAVAIIGLAIKGSLFPLFLMSLETHFSHRLSLNIANILALIIVTFFNFTLNYFWTWKSHHELRVTKKY